VIWKPWSRPSFSARLPNCTCDQQLGFSVSSIVLQHLLPPVLAQFAPAFPEVLIELAATRDHANLRRPEADVAIRIADSVADWLVGRKLASLHFKI
jgi:DNA-binding transcriptional LysR family regulator